MSKDSPTLLTVRDAAERLGVTPRTLKYYEERGLVSPTRSEGRYRLYDEEDLQRFDRILRLRSLGFSLHSITEMLKQPLEPIDGRNRYSTESLQQIRDAIAQQVDALDARIEAMRRETHLDQDAAGAHHRADEVTLKAARERQFERGFA